MAAATLDSPGLYSDGHFEQEDVIFPCKACGDILEEGKAYELAGNRWHIDCFRCNTCGTLLDSDANLLLLGDGSLICNNCTYSCSACGDKIEDLAILTGDQAFCSGCFRCRNCKKKIDNLRYARTSQGIFCMTCHESLMARRRKKSKASTRPAQGGTTREKALPSLPPDVGSQNVPANREPAATDKSETPSARSLPERHQSRKEGVADTQTDVSRLHDESRSNGQTLPARTYGDEKSSSNTARASADGEEQGYLPMAFDPSPAPAPPPLARSPLPPQNDMPPPRDYFNRALSKSQRDAVRDHDRSEMSRSLSAGRNPERTPSLVKKSPHIFYQDKTRQQTHESPNHNGPPPSSNALHSAMVGVLPEKNGRPNGPPSDHSPSTADQPETSKLAEAPRLKPAVSRMGSTTDRSSPRITSEAGIKDGQKAVPSPRQPTLDEPKSSVSDLYNTTRRVESPLVGNNKSSASEPVERLARGDSLMARSRNGKTPTPEPSTPTISGTSSMQSFERKGSTASTIQTWTDSQSNLSRNVSHSTITESPVASIDSPPPRSSSRPGAAAPPSTTDAPAIPRTAPGPSPLVSAGQHRASGSMLKNDAVPPPPPLYSPALPQSSLDGIFSMEEEMMRIMNGEVKRDPQLSEVAGPAVRKLSNAAKHARSFSDRGLSSAGRASINGTIDNSASASISSPMSPTFAANEGMESLVAQLRRAHRRIAELEATNTMLQDKMNSSTEIKAATNELREKRTTMVVLDTQREMVVRELEAMTEHLARAKNTNQPLDLNSLKTSILKDFAESLQKLKHQMSVQIEELMHKRNEITNDISNLIQMKDKGFQEYENLSNKNNQLLQMNEQIMQNIQQMYRTNRAPNGGANGLGIFHSGTHPDISGPSDPRNFNSMGEGPMHGLDHDVDSATVLQGPQVVSIRKAQPKRFNWRKGGEKVAKGIKGAFIKDENGAPYGVTVVGAGNGDTARQGSDAGKLGLFSQKGGLMRPELKSSNSNNNLAAPDATVLFGSDLEARCELERRMIPAVVSRCIEEVEARGMDMEGIYRKSGGAGQVKILQQGFERDGNFDISDPDLDIHAVTSALKQYFRKLPVPLVTYDAYESLLEAGRIDDREKQVVALRAAVTELPDAHRNCLELLFSHLSRVVDKQAVNLMTPLNLAVVFAPTIMRPMSIEREMTDMQAQRIAVQALLERREAVFADDG